VGAATRFIPSYPAGYNDPRVAHRATATLKRHLGERRVIAREQPSMFSEDFSYYLQLTPGLFCHLGVQKPGRSRSCGTLHGSRFLPDESALKTGMTTFAALALDTLLPVDERR
jgi:metal-dependent amidase/aminoacylase/carboxypeptidase family protein